MIICGSKDWAMRVAWLLNSPYISDQDSLIRYLNGGAVVDKIFFLHWHWRVPNWILEKYECIGFHSADLPAFRGGSPIQNQLKRGIKKTKLTAFRLVEKFDAGNILLKEDLSLEGSMEDILGRIERLTPGMIRKILRGEYVEQPQSGEASFYSRADAL